MSIRTVTKLAAVGVGTGLAFALVYPFVLDNLGYGMTATQRVTMFRICGGIQMLLTHGSILVFLVVLASKQKEQA